ncbi:MAG TPA: ATP-binding protein [Casimicrobiaceae bacterium]|nr:ATP-binding protein [Casimicrobiaceae bacterium]
MNDRTGWRRTTLARSGSIPDTSALHDLGDHLFHRDALTLAEQSAGIGVWSIDLKTGLVRGTAQFFRIMGLEPTGDQVPLEALRALRHPQDRARVLAGFRNALEGGSDSYEMEYRVIHPDGRVRWIFGRGRVVRDADGTPIRYSGVDLDITDRKAAEAELAAAKAALEQMNQALEERVRERTAALEAEADRRMQAEARLHQAQKMEAVGQLTGGLAHDFNNILQVISGNLEIAARLLSRSPTSVADKARDPLLAAIASAQRSAQSAKNLVNQMLGFSRLQSLTPSIFRIDDLVTVMADMIRRTLGETIDVEIVSAPDAWMTRADRNQLETALLNLVVNARDAMPSGGRLTIETANAAIADGRDDLPRGDYALLAVRDTGCGIPEDVLPKVFEPFFTTKDTGRGSGLGLSMVYGFVTQSGGHVRIASNPGAGTCVRIYLPRATETVAATHPSSESRMASGPSGAIGEPLARARPGESILVVEDNVDVRRLGVAALEQLGYHVLQAPDAHSALRLLDSEAALRIDAVFSDVVLPGGLSGPELVDRIRCSRPGIPALFTSGYTPDSVGAHRRLAGDRRMLMKPYRIDALAAAIRQTIDESR